MGAFSTVLVIALGVAAGANALAIDCRDTLLRSDHPDVQVVGIGLTDVVAARLIPVEPFRGSSPATRSR